MSINNSVSGVINYPLTGKIPVNMTNDLLFHYLLQDEENTEIVKGMISSFYDIPFESIKSVTVENPISYGEDFSSKEMVLDVKILLNNNQIINFEMQVINYKDWPERSLSYLCRCFDNLKSGEGYVYVKGAYHIGFLNYTLFPDAPEFYATYTLRNVKTNRPYTSKFGISVVDLSLIDKALEEDKKKHRHLWASFFKATTWEEIHMIATQDCNIEKAAVKLNQLVEDKKLRDEIWAREDHNRRLIDMRYAYESEIKEKNNIIEEKDATIAEMEAKIKQLMKRIEEKDDAK